jgi:hypothetical protein
MIKIICNLCGETQEMEYDASEGFECLSPVVPEGWSCFKGNGKILHFHDKEEGSCLELWMQQERDQNV